MGPKSGVNAHNSDTRIYGVSRKTDSSLESGSASGGIIAAAFGRGFPHRATSLERAGRALVPSGRGDVTEQGNGELPVTWPAPEIATDRRRSPDEERNVFRHLVERARVGVLVCDEREIIYANAEAARLFGYASTEDLAAVGRTELLLAESDRAGLRKLSAALLEGRRTQRVYDAIGLRSDGSRIEIEVHPSATEWHAKPALCAIVVDVTARREAETLALSQITELAHFDRICTLGQMSATIMHEIAQPLTALSVMGGALRRLLSQSEPKLESAIRAAETIDLEAKRMRATIERIKQFASGHARQGDDDWEVIDVVDPIRQAFLLNAAAFDGACVELDLDDEADPAARMVFADQVQLGQVIVNLVANALDSVTANETPHAKVHVGVRTVGDAVLVDVTDNGPGVPPDIADRIFDPFFSTKPKGVGIGLAVCRSIVDAFGGTLRHFPAAGGHGAVFRMCLPSAKRI